MESDYERGIRRLRARILRMPPRVLVTYDYRADTRFIVLEIMAKNRQDAQEKYLAFSYAARCAYIAARNSFLDNECTYMKAAKPFYELAALSRKWCHCVDVEPYTPAHFKHAE